MGAILYYTLLIFLALYLGTIVISAVNSGTKGVLLIAGTALVIYGQHNTFVAVIGTLAIGISLTLALRETVRNS